MVSVHLFVVNACSELNKCSFVLFTMKQIKLLLDNDKVNNVCVNLT